MPQIRNCRCGFPARIDQIFRERADDSIAAGQAFADLVFMSARCFNDASGGSVDHRSDSAGLGIERIHLGHFAVLPRRNMRVAFLVCCSEQRHFSALNIRSRIDSMEPTPVTFTYFGAPAAPLFAQLE